MTRTHALPALLLLCTALALAGVPRGGSVDRAGLDVPALRPLAPPRDCKPMAPVELGLRQVGEADGRVVLLELHVQPRGGTGDVAWQLVLPPGATLLEGPAHGLGAADGTPAAPQRVRVLLPADAGFARIALDAAAALEREGEAADATAIVHARRALAWGDPQAALAAARQRRGPVAVAGVPAPRLAQVPTQHRAGR
jgi:hypothetical protein